MISHDALTPVLCFHYPAFVDMGSMYSKPCRIQLGYALFVVEFATVAYVVKQKDGPQLALYIKRLLLILDQNWVYHGSCFWDWIEAKLKCLLILDINIGLQISCTLPYSNPALRNRCEEKCRSFQPSFSKKVATLLWCGQVSWG